jgi:hypothetical protein
MSASLVTRLPYEAAFVERGVDAVLATRPDAQFVAHLLATRGNVPDYRLKNRIAPETGAKAYFVSMTRPAPKRRPAGYSI